MIPTETSSTLAPQASREIILKGKKNKDEVKKQTKQTKHPKQTKQPKQ
jgi:hypothetical protein